MTKCSKYDTCTYQPKDIKCEDTSKFLNPCLLLEVRENQELRSPVPMNKRTPDSDRQRIAEFSEAMFQKWQKGRIEHGSTVKINPVEEAMKECTDLANYSMEIYFRLKALQEKIHSLRW